MVYVCVLLSLRYWRSACCPALLTLRATMRGIWLQEEADSATASLPILTRCQCRKNHKRRGERSLTGKPAAASPTGAKKSGIIERVISNGKITRGEVFVRGADECQETAASMRDTHMMPFQQRAAQKPP